MPFQSSFAETFVLPPPGVDVVGEPRITRARYEDTLSDIARRYNLGYREIVLANPGVDPWLPGEGTEILLPSLYILPNTPREGIVLNVPEMRLYYFPAVEAGELPTVITFPVAIGRMEWKTPLGITKVTKKVAKPAWYPPASIRAEAAENGDFLPKRVAPGPDNPLGTHTLRLGIPGYLIHGTNKPYGVGMRVTHGCVRLYPENIRTLFDNVPVGVSVNIINQPYKAGWRNGMLYIESHPILDEEKNGNKNEDEKKELDNITPAIKVVLEKSPESNSDIDWEKLVTVVKDASGVPIVISTETLDVAAVLSVTQSNVRAKLDLLTERSDNHVP